MNILYAYKSRWLSGITHSNYFFVMRIALLVLFLSIFTKTVFADTKSGSNSSNVAITAADVFVGSTITLSGAPANAVISSVNVSWNIDADYIPDIWYFINKDGWSGSSWYQMVKTGNNLVDSYDETSDDSRTYYSIPSGT
jgi:hypothetical protein